jgi:hypothetical protein
MSQPDTRAGNDPQLAERIARQIDRRTFGRVRRLHVARTDRGVVVQGQSPSYYIKQLAIRAVYEALGRQDETPVSLDIRVGAGGPRASV